MRREIKVLQLARDRGSITIAHVIRLLQTNVHDAARLLYELRNEGLLQSKVITNVGHGLRLHNTLTAAGRNALCGRLCSPPQSVPDFGPLLAVGFLLNPRKEQVS